MSTKVTSLADGYYLSIYAHIDALCHVHDISVRHDQNMALWYFEHGCVELVRYWEFERFTGLKHHARSFVDETHAKTFINHLLSEFNLSIDILQGVWGTPGLSSVDDKIWMKHATGFTSHTLAHLFSTLLLDTDKFNNETILALAMDGGPDTVIDSPSNSCSFYVGALVRQGKISFFPVSSPGGLWSYLSQTLQIKEGTLMALGSACECTLLQTEFAFKPIYSMEDHSQNIPIIETLLARVAEISTSNESELHSGIDSRFTLRENQVSAAVKVIQAESIKWVKQQISNVIQANGIEPKNTYLALAGGFTLNCVTNTELMQYFNFSDFIAPPCVNDSGISLGYGLWAFYTFCAQFDFKFSNAGLGFRNAPITDNELAPLTQIIEDIEKGPIVWIESGAEVGPRALGHRSLIIDPRYLKFRDALNQVKGRQWWRPVAPIILQHYISQWFDGFWLSPYMLQAYKVKPNKLQVVPAVIHLDGSARVQTLASQEAPLLYEVLTQFNAKTGVPILGNTSLNEKGQPIINSYQQALTFAQKNGIEICYFDGIRINVSSHIVKHEVKADLQVDFIIEDVKANELNKQLNPFNLTSDELKAYWYTPRLRLLSLDNANDVKLIQRFAKKFGRIKLSQAAPLLS
jgi:carbamoyltransferase